LEFVLYGLVGLLSGVLGGMGMGGGTILIPLLTIFFSVSQHLAQGVNLISFIPMAVVALVLHFKNKLIEKKGLLFVIIPSFLLSVLGTIVTLKIDGEVLKRIFGGFLLALSVVQFFSDKIIKKFKKER
jgi:uncharacterized membrane protein YfcA